MANSLLTDVQHKLQMWAGRPVGSPSQWADTVWQPRGADEAEASPAPHAEDSQYLTGFDSQYLDDPAQGDPAASMAAEPAAASAASMWATPALPAEPRAPAPVAAPVVQPTHPPAAPAPPVAQAQQLAKVVSEAPAPAARAAAESPAPSAFAASSMFHTGAETLPPGPSLPVTLGRFAVKSRMPSGRLGRLYEAWDLDRACPAVIRILNLPAPADARAQLDQQLVKTGRAAVALKHPHIASVYGAGASAWGVFIATERLKGRDMRKALALGWRPRPSLTALIVRRLADAVAHAHARGVVHGDIQPANIFLDDLARPKLLDFGIAQVAYSRGIDRTEVPLSRLAYLAPEQLLQGTADTRTDIRAVGLVLYELLAMSPAFSGETVGDVTRAVLQNQPSPIEGVRKNVPKTLVGIAMKAMATDPEQRFASAEEMAAALAVWVERHAARKRELAEANRGRRYGEPKLRKPFFLRPWVLPVVLPVALTVCSSLVIWQWMPQIKVLFEPQARPDPAPAAGLAPSPGLAANPGSRAATTAPVATAAAPVAGSTVRPANTPTPEPAAAPGALAAQAPAAGELLTASELEQRKAAYAAKGLGLVALEVSPAAEVLVNGAVTGTTPPMTQLKLPLGRQTITLRSPGFQPYTITVMVRNDQPVELLHRFAR